MTKENAWRTTDWARAIAALDRGGPLPAATALVPRAAVAHALRKELVRLDRRDVLGGTLFVGASVAATEVLANARVAFDEGEDGLRPARMRALFREELALAYFDVELLREALGWEEAFARTIGELEGAGLAPDDLERAARGASDTDAARLRDVAKIWRAANQSAGASWTRARVLAEASAILAKSRDAWPYHGPTLVALTGHESAVEARFAKAIPDVRLITLAARPGGASPARTSGSELALLQSYLFDDASLDESRPRSAGPDGTVHLEEHAGIDEELEAAADWVARQVFERRTPLEEIALLLAEPDPTAALLVDRLARRGIPAHVSSGVPACTTSAGARALTVVRALRSYLGFEVLAEVLPTLRLAADDDDEIQARHLPRGVARALAFSLGTVGGSAAHPAGALAWPEQIRKRRGTIERAIRDAKEDPEESAREREYRKQLAASLRAVEPALLALVDVARAAIDEAPLRALGPRIAAFLDQWLLAPGAGRAALASLAASVATLARDAACGALTGDDALRVVEEALLAQRIPVGRFGDPSVHIDTVVRAAGLPFQAVRILGLAEGALPSPPRQDAVLPDRCRALLGTSLATSDRAMVQLHAVDRIVRDTRGVIAFSAPRLGVDRSYREPSSVFVEAATALGRPNATTGTRDAIVPDGRALRRDSFLPARQSAAAFRHTTPIAEAAWHDRVARIRERAAIDPTALAAPARWRTEPHVDPSRMASLHEVGSALDGILGDAAAALNLPGLTPERPISASALAALLGCPHRFLFERGFGWREPAEAPSARELDALTYGSLFHSVAERLFETHGADIGARKGTPQSWYPIAEKIAVEAFDELLDRYPLTGEAVRDAQRDRLLDDVAALVDHELAETKARFVAVERPFGSAEPLPWKTKGGPLHLLGYIDRIDVVGAATRVRDLKTGKAHPRKPDDAPDPRLDVQIALYALVAAELAGTWGVPKRVVGQYVYANARGVALRDWDGRMDVLTASARDWLELAGALLRAGDMPRSSSGDDCRYCPFTAVCGDDRNARAAAVFGATKRLQPLATLKGGA